MGGGGWWMGGWVDGWMGGWILRVHTEVGGGGGMCKRECEEMILDGWLFEISCMQS